MFLYLLRFSSFRQIIILTGVLPDRQSIPDNGAKKGKEKTHEKQEFSPLKTQVFFEDFCRGMKREREIYGLCDISQHIAMRRDSTHPYSTGA